MHRIDGYSLYAYRTMNGKIEVIQGACRNRTAPEEYRTCVGGGDDEDVLRMTMMMLFSAVNDSTTTRRMPMRVGIVDCSISCLCSFVLVGEASLSR